MYPGHLGPGDRVDFVDLPPEGEPLVGFSHRSISRSRAERNEQASNLYSYVGNNPVNAIDPSGLFEWEKTFEVFLTRYTDEGLALFQWAVSKGWTVEKRQYGWFSLRDDWWKIESESVLAIGATDFAGTVDRSDSNAADQLMEGLRSIYAEEVETQRERQELEYLIGEEYADLPWYERWYRFIATVGLTSWIGSGIKNLEVAWVGETLLGDKISTGDRALLATIGSIETLLVAVPLGKGATALGGKLGLGKIGGVAVARLMAADITFGLGQATATRLLQTTAGKAFMRAYARVYSRVYVRLLEKQIENRIQELVKNYTGKLAKDLYEKKVRTIFHNRLQGKITEKVFNQLLGGTGRTYKVAVGGKTVTRYVDNVIGNVAREVKSGPLKLNPFIKQQILKDAQLIKDFGLRVEWHLFAGGQQTAITALNRAGIKVITY